MSGDGPRVAVVTGASQGIGARLVTGYRAQGWAVVANSRDIKPSDDPAVLTVEGDISQPATADRIVRGALERFGRIDTLVNNAGVFIGKPFTDYTIKDYQLVVHVNLTGFFLVTQRVIAVMLKGGGGHIVNISTTMVEHASSSAPALLATLTTRTGRLPPVRSPGERDELPARLQARHPSPPGVHSAAICVHSNLMVSMTDGHTESAIGALATGLKITQSHNVSAPSLA